MGETRDSLSEKDAHKLRTSIRRIEVALEPSGKFRGSKKLRRQLDTLRRMAGHVRDVDVHTEMLRNLDAGDYHREREALQNALIRRREKLEKKAVASISKQRDKGLEERLESASKSIVENVAPLKVASRQRVEHIREQFVEFTQEIPLDGDPLHDLRKSSKRLRYALEAIPGRESRSLEKELKSVQDALGAWHDWATLTMEAEKRLDPRSIAFVAFLRSLSIGKRHEARRSVQILRDKLTRTSLGKKPPSRATIQSKTQQHAAR